MKGAYTIFASTQWDLLSSVLSCLRKVNVHIISPHHPFTLALPVLPCHSLSVSLQGASVDQVFNHVILLPGASFRFTHRGLPQNSALYSLWGPL